MHIFALVYGIYAMSRLNMDFDNEEDKSIDALKREYGIKQTTELMRFIIKHQSKLIANSSPQRNV